MSTFKIITLGCKVNQYESACMREALQEQGWREVPGEGAADVTLVNTCIVTARAAYQSRQAVRRAVRENVSGRVAAVGCYAQVYPEELSRIPGLDLMVDNAGKGRLPDLLGGEKAGGAVRQTAESEVFPVQPLRSFLDRTRAFLKIQDGCRSFCTYCVVPYARGPLKSLAPDPVVRALKSFSDQGFREVVLTGIHMGKYGKDLDCGIDLKGLLRRIKRESLGLKIRLSSIEPNEIDSGLIEMVASEAWLCRHFHSPLQSGDDRVLKAMKRPYGADDFRELVLEIHDRIPLAAIGADAMVGFPGEDESAFRNTYSLLEGLPISYLHVFPFSRRKGTPAAAFPDQVESKIAKERASLLRRLGREKLQAFWRSCSGEIFSVLAQGWASEERKMIRGLSDNYLRVAFPSPSLIANAFVPVRVMRPFKDGVLGCIAEDGRGTHCDPPCGSLRNGR